MNDRRLIWIDLEMSGLDPERERILEMAVIVTDASLKVIAEAPVFVVHQDDDLLANMDEWNTQHHTASGLVERVRASDLTEHDVQAQMIAFLKAHVPAGASPMCGNTVHQDRRFLVKWMPELERYFHYRHIDVSTIKELAHRWAPDVLRGFSKENKHQALDDIRESIAELCYYRREFFRV